MTDINEQDHPSYRRAEQAEMTAIQHADCIRAELLDKIESVEAAKEPGKWGKRFYEFGHQMQRLRVAQLLALAFVCLLVWDFHMFYKEHAMDMTEWQMVSVGAYAAAFVAALKVMFEAIGKRVDREDP